MNDRGKVKVVNAVMAQNILKKKRAILKAEGSVDNNSYAKFIDTECEGCGSRVQQDIDPAKMLQHLRVKCDNCDASNYTQAIIYNIN